MSALSRQFCQTELVQSILEMATTGVYRESILETLQPVAPKTQIRHAITQAKSLGLYSVASLRDPVLGTYYTVDPVQYQRLKPLLNTSQALTSPPELLHQVLQTTQAMQGMLNLTLGAAIVLSAGGLFCLLTHHAPLAVHLLFCSLTTSGIWVLQRSLLHSTTRHTQP